MKKPIRNYIILITIVGLFFCAWLIVTLLQGHSMISSQKAYISIPMEKRFDIYAKSLSDIFEEADVTMKYDKNAKFLKSIGDIEIKKKYDMYRKYDLSDGSELYIFLTTNEDNSKDKINFFVKTTSHENAIDIASDMASKDYIIYGFVNLCEDFKKVSRYRNLVNQMIENYSLNTLNSIYPTTRCYKGVTDTKDVSVQVNCVMKKEAESWNAYIYANRDFYVNMDFLKGAL